MTFKPLEKDRVKRVMIGELPKDTNFSFSEYRARCFRVIGTANGMDIGENSKIFFSGTDGDLRYVDPEVKVYIDAEPELVRLGDLPLHYFEYEGELYFKHQTLGFCKVNASRLSFGENCLDYNTLVRPVANIEIREVE